LAFFAADDISAVICEKYDMEVLRMKRILATAGGLLLAVSIVGQAGAFGIDNIESRQKGSKNNVISAPGLPDKQKAGPVQKPYLVAQSAADNSVRVNQLQEQVRSLNGKVEELAFQLLQLQEQIRKMQEDNEFRFQELEDKHSELETDKTKNSNLASKGDNRLGKPQPSEGAQTSTPSGGKTGNDTIKEAGRILGAPPRSLGTLRFDANGNVIESAVGKPLDLSSLGKPLGGSGVELSNLKPATLLARGRDFFDAGDYVLAEKTLQQMIKTYPEESRRPEAQYWIGRSLFARGDFHAAATVFLDTHNAYPDAPRAPDTLLRLGLSMAGLNHREIACATYAEVGKQFPNADEKVKKQVAIEQKSAGCT